MALIWAMAAVLASPAFACSPLAPPAPPAPPPGTSSTDAEALNQAWNQAHWTRAAEDDRARLMKRQAELFDTAASIALVRFDHADKSSGAPAQFSYLNGLPLVVLKPVAWMKGKGVSGDLQLVMNPQAPCGQSPAQDAFRGKPGEVFLIYFSGEALLQTDVLDGYALGRIIEPRALAALTEPAK